MCSKGRGSPEGSPSAGEPRPRCCPTRVPQTCLRSPSNAHPTAGPSHTCAPYPSLTTSPWSEKGPCGSNKNDCCVSQGSGLPRGRGSDPALGSWGAAEASFAPAAASVLQKALQGFPCSPDWPVPESRPHLSQPRKEEVKGGRERLWGGLSRRSQPLTHLVSLPRHHRAPWDVQKCHPVIQQRRVLGRERQDQDKELGDKAEAVRPL